MKRSPADNWFSKCVRERSDWKCDRCGKAYEENSQGLHASHLWTRAIYALRFDPDAVVAHCYPCHLWYGSNPIEGGTWAREYLGEGLLDILMEKRVDTGLGKQIRKDEKKGYVAKHYREQYKQLKQKRAEGVTGRIDFEGYL